MPEEKKSEKPAPSGRSEETKAPSATPSPGDTSAAEIPHQEPEEKNLGEQLTEQAEKEQKEREG